MSRLKYTKQLSVKKTEGEWTKIDVIVSASGKKDLNAYIRCEALKIKKAFGECPEQVTPAKGVRIEKRPYIPLTIYAALEPLALRMGVPVSSVIDRFIIDPMLLPKI